MQLEVFLLLNIKKFKDLNILEQKKSIHLSNINLN